MPQLCNAHPIATEYLGAPCPFCGHTTVAHPGEHNPALDSCALCQIAAAVDELRGNVQLVAAAVDVELPDVAQLAQEAAALQLAQAPEYDQVQR
jgi:hypothetical protein